MKGQKNPDDWISVYLDWYDALGFMGAPYWEAYSIEGDTARFMLEETSALISAIDGELKKKELT